MTADRVQMVKVLSHKGRLRYLKQVADLIDTNASSILDLGCGVGMLAALLRARAPEARIIGLDLSSYLLKEMRRRLPDPNVVAVQGRMPELPLLNGSLDAVVAVQALHEVFHFMGSQSLQGTLERAYSLLADDGVFVAMDHQNPGEGLVRVKMPSRSLERLEYFKEHFKPRIVQYTPTSDGLLEMSLRDLYDFVTKIWSFGTDLEDEEMNETHTPFTAEEIASKFIAAGFAVDHQETLNPIEKRLKPFGIEITGNYDLPARYFLLKASK